MLERLERVEREEARKLGGRLEGELVWFLRMTEKHNYLDYLWEEGGKCPVEKANVQAMMYGERIEEGPGLGECAECGRYDSDRDPKWQRIEASLCGNFF